MHPTYPSTVDEKEYLDARLYKMSSFNLDTFLGKESEIDVLNYWRRTPLFYAVLTNNEELLEILIEAHANIELYDIYQRTVLHEAADKVCIIISAISIKNLC